MNVLSSIMQKIEITEGRHLKDVFEVKMEMQRLKSGSMLIVSFKGLSYSLCPSFQCFHNLLSKLIAYIMLITI